MNNNSEKTSNEGSLKREIGLFGGISIVGGIMIGSGIFYLGSYVLERTGMSMGLALLCWVIGGGVSLLGGLCFAELGAARPASGGMVVYLNEAYHPVVGYMFGFTSWLLSGAGSISAIAIALPTIFKGYFEMSEMTIKVIAIVLIVALTLYNCLGIKQGTVLQSISMVAKIIPIVVIIMAALLKGEVNPDLSLTSANGDASFGSIIGMIAFATVATLWAYEGWTNLNSVAEEMKNPAKNLPRALIISIGAITLIYTLFNFAIYKVLPFDQVTQMINGGDLYLGTAVAKTVFGGVGGILVFSTMVIAMFSSLNGMIIAFPRNYYAMAREGHFFKAFGHINPKTNVPTVALIAQAVIASVLVLLRNLDQLTSLVVFAGMMFNMLTVVAVIVYRKRYPELKRPYKAWGYPVTVIITAVIYTALMINTLVEDPITALVGLVVPALGAVVYFIFDRKLKAEKKDLSVTEE